jgi:hypothetical protein
MWLSAVFNIPFLFATGEGRAPQIHFSFPETIFARYNLFSHPLIRGNESTVVVCLEVQNILSSKNHIKSGQQGVQV